MNTRVVILAIVTLLATTKSRAQQPTHSLPTFSPHEIEAAAANVSFRADSSMAIEASDALEYFDVSSKVVLREGGPILLGRMRVKADGVRLKGGSSVLPPGDYYDWVGKNNGMWVRGYSTLEGKTLVVTQAHFGIPPAERHQSGFHVFFHDPARVEAAKVGMTVSALPGTKPPPPPPGREPPSSAKPPRCVMKCKTLLDLDQDPPREYWLPDWVEVP